MAKQTNIVRAACDELISKVRFEHASFTLGNTMPNDHDTVRIKEATRLYMNTWVIPLLESIRDGDTENLKHARHI